MFTVYFKFLIFKRISQPFDCLMFTIVKLYIILTVYYIIITVFNNWCSRGNQQNIRFSHYMDWVWALSTRSHLVPPKRWFCLIDRPGLTIVDIAFQYFNSQPVGEDSWIPHSLSNHLENILQPTISKMSPAIMISFNLKAFVWS